MHKLFDSTAMQRLPSPVSLVLVRLGRALQSLQRSMKTWVPQPAPELVPIPIRVDRRHGENIQRDRYRGF